MKFNDLNLQDWKNLEIDVNSLWIINERDKSGKHKNVYHGNFIPQIPRQLIQRFTNKNDTVLDVFLGSGTTLYECETFQRKFIGLDINPKMIEYVNNQMGQDYQDDFHIELCDVTNEEEVNLALNKGYNKLKINKIDFVIMHPPYLDIIKFTEHKNDLSQISDLTTFVKKFIAVCQNTLKYLSKDRYFAIVMGDVYKNGEVIPASFYLMDAIKRNFSAKLKGIVVKNIEGNKAKLGKDGIWTYRALNSDYYIFKHEYIFVFKKEF